MNINPVNTKNYNNSNVNIPVIKANDKTMENKIFDVNKNNIRTKEFDFSPSDNNDDILSILELKEISEDYKKNMIMSKSRASDTVLDPSESILKLEKYYQNAKENILKNFSGDEQIKKIEVLDKAFKENSENIINSFSSFTQIIIGQEKLFEKMRMMISKGVHYMEDLEQEDLNALETSFKRFDGIKNNLMLLKKLVSNLHNKDNSLSELLSTANKITESMEENLSKTYGVALKNKDEIDKLNLEKVKIYEYDYKNMTDEEKYQSAAKNKKELEKIDKRIKSFVEYELKIR
ncbi:hypothetical protein [Peptoanaerobacter stomatis]|uniref:hypothetical protein n=1 Tax=Peptoanaerobacter stomatis TaxID=796937 RepID=UPI003FA0CCA9